MSRKILFSSLAVIIVSSILVPSLFSSATPTAIPASISDQVGISRSEKQSVLDATIHITFYPKRVYESSDDSFGGQQNDSEAGYLVERARGIGTVVSYGSHLLIITHDHWEWMGEALDRVEFRDANNGLLLEISGEAFNNIVRYRDGGTLIIDAPGILLSSGIVPASLNQEKKIAAGSTIYMAYRPLEDRDQVDLRPVMVESIEEDAGRPVLRLRSLDGEAFIVGDSGGGAWFGGQLVGNLWMSLTVEIVVQETRIWGTREIVETTADTSIAAQFPLDEQALASTLVISSPSESAEQ